MLRIKTMTLNPYRWKLNEWKGFEGKVRVNLHRNYVNQGKGLIGFIWGFIALYALASDNVLFSFIFGVIFYIISYFMGRHMYKYRWVEADIEATNRYNPFIKEMRNHLKSKTFK